MNKKLDIECKAYYTLRVKYALLIQELRKAMGGVTQSELADAVNVSRQTIISLENGRYNASLILAHKIAKYFDVAIEELFLFDDTDE